jgi:hypothetical protein
LRLASALPARRAWSACSEGADIASVFGFTVCEKDLLFRLAMLVLVEIFNAVEGACAL